MGGGGGREDDEGAGEICSEAVEQRRPTLLPAYFPRLSSAARSASSTCLRYCQVAGANSSAADGVMIPSNPFDRLVRCVSQSIGGAVIDALDSR